eukprot:4261606-Amphidinium_carterae.1
MTSQLQLQSSCARSYQNSDRTGYYQCNHTFVRAILMALPLLCNYSCTNHGMLRWLIMIHSEILRVCLMRWVKGSGRINSVGRSFVSGAYTSHDNAWAKIWNEAAARQRSSSPAATWAIQAQ